VEKLPVPLKVVILDSDASSAKVLKAVVESKPDIEAVETSATPQAADRLFREQGFNSLFIDVFSVGTVEGVKFIEHTREKYPTIPICLYSVASNLVTTPGVDNNWHRRFSHYYKVLKDQTVPALDSAVEDILPKLSNWFLTRTAQTRVSDITTLINTPGTNAINQQQRNEIIEIVAEVEKALKVRAENYRYNEATIVPGVDTAQIEQLVNTTLKEATQSLRITTNVNIGVLIAGSALVFISFLVASITGRWEAVAFGGFGTAGIVASLIVNPLKSIGASARRLVQIQVAYLAFVSQLALLNRDSDRISEIDRSQRLGEEMARTLEVLEKQSGK
jgi:CheY-like chemotaxis protein